VDRVVARAVALGLGVTLGLGALIWGGSRRLAHFDAALAAYTTAVLFAAFGLTYRYAMWLQRPPTAMLWRRGWQAFFRRGRRGRNAADWVRHVSSDFVANRFILSRGWLRGVTHLLIVSVTIESTQVRSSGRMRAAPIRRYVRGSGPSL
jgi:hypothetical protein